MIDEQTGKIVLEHYSHASLYVDIDCFGCKHLVGLPNAIKWEGRYYHERCLPETYWQFIDSKLDWEKFVSKKKIDRPMKMFGKNTE